jgi:hypothetical protein
MIEMMATTPSRFQIDTSSHKTRRHALSLNKNHAEMNHSYLKLLVFSFLVINTRTAFSLVVFDNHARFPFSASITYSSKVRRVNFLLFNDRSDRSEQNLEKVDESCIVDGDGDDDESQQLTLCSDLSDDAAQQPWSRNTAWIEEATLDFFDEELYPLGKLTEYDVEAVVVLMAAWVRRRSVDAALTVERLLKRVVDDMRADNSAAHVSTRFYTYVSP